VAKSKEDLISAILVARKFKLPFFILGGGSNVLVSDKGFKGLVIKIQNSRLRQGFGGQAKFKTIYAEAGTPLALVVSEAVKNSLTDLEWAIGIPGTVEGAIFGNAGAFENEISDVVKEVEVYDTKENKIKIFKKQECQFDYRESIFKKNKNLIILSAQIQLKRGKKSEIERKIKEYLNYRKKTQPLNFPSAGSIFKNPEGFLAAKLIENSNLKGKRIGDVKISEKHANFIVNLGKGKAMDVKKLIYFAKKKVKEKFKITLKEEIQYLGF